MKLAINVQNVSDVITNSSSEIFICQSDNPEQTASLIEEVLTNVYENLKRARDNAGNNTYSYYGESLDDLMTIYVADNDYTDDGWGYSYKKGDIIIESQGDNSIPPIMMDFIYEFFAWDKCNRIHLG
jgi:hypothetical protein